MALVMTKCMGLALTRRLWGGGGRLALTRHMGGLVLRRRTGGRGGGWH